VRARKGPEERLTPEQLSGFFARLKSRIRIVVWIGAVYWQREAEIFGLRWSDVELDKRLIHVRRQYAHGSSSSSRRPSPVFATSASMPSSRLS